MEAAVNLDMVSRSQSDGNINTALDISSSFNSQTEEEIDILNGQLATNEQLSGTSLQRLVFES